MPPQDEPRSSSKPTLIIDSHPATRLGLRSVLTRIPELAIVDESSDGESALKLKEHQAALVVLGVTKLAAGLSLLSAIRQVHQRARTLLLSPVAEPLWADQALRAGADGFALKKSAADELLRAVTTVLEGRPYVDPSLRVSLATGDTRTSKLSSREDQVIRHFAAGQPAKLVAELLGISPRTLETYRARAMTKLGLRTRAELVRHALRSGWLPEP